MQPLPFFRPAAALLFLSLALGAVSAMAETVPPPTKKATASARLVLPWFEVDLNDPNGASTFFSVRNETTALAAVRVSYFAADRAGNPQAVQNFNLAAKQIRSVALRTVNGLLADDDGFARGYAIIETVGGEQVIQGDFYQINPDQAFATGDRLVNADPNSLDEDLCSLFTLRFLNGGGFSGGTEIVIWLDTDQLPSENDPAVTYTVYRENGERVFSQDLPLIQVATRLRVETLVRPVPTNFGALEIQLNDLEGHVAATLSALGLYSIGLEASCGN